MYNPDDPQACRYSYVHWTEAEPATTTVPIDGLGMEIPACQPCADFYEENSR